MTVKISFYDGVFSGECTVYEAESVGHWILDNKSKLVNFAVFDGQPSLETDITKDVQKLIATDGDYVVLSSWLPGKRARKVREGSDMELLEC